MAITPDILEKAIAEVREIRLLREAEEKAKQGIQVVCPDCGATLRLLSSDPLPADLRVVFVEHAC